MPNDFIFPTITFIVTTKEDKDISAYCILL